MVADDRLTTPSRPSAQLDLRERMAATSWADPGLVFPNTKGKIRRRDTVIRSLKGFLEEAGLPVDVRFHDLGHTAGPGVAYYEDPPDGDGVLVHAAIPVDADPGEDHDFAIVDLPEIEQEATIVDRGAMDDVMPTIQVLARWIDANGYRSVGYNRELYTELGENTDAWVT
jgi:effector-binding domain-containing protein